MGWGRQELASHPTVSYIQTLEEDVRRYQKAIQEERKKAIELKTALDSYRRTTTISMGLPSVASFSPFSPGSPSSTGRSPMPRPGTVPTQLGRTPRSGMTPSSPLTHLRPFTPQAVSFRQ
jgi:hypothetical protein